jgi:tetratricopeptide (TPR) repeat protein
MKKFFVLMITVFIFSAWMDPFKDEVEKGNSSIKSGNPKEALEHYKEAEKHAPDNKSKSLLDFNRGAAHYHMGNYDIASDKYKSSISSENPDIQKKSLFNMGNSFMKEKKYKEAADCYIKALQVDPNYEKAKKNLEYLLKKQNDKNENSDRQSGDEKNQKDKKSGKNGNSTDGEKDMKGIQAKNLLESMKNKPVRKQKGKGDGAKYLEKYW